MSENAQEFFVSLRSEFRDQTTLTAVLAEIGVTVDLPARQRTTKVSLTDKQRTAVSATNKVYIAAQQGLIEDPETSMDRHIANVVIRQDGSGSASAVKISPNAADEPAHLKRTWVPKEFEATELNAD
jgi:hypothetical protein